MITGLASRWKGKLGGVVGLSGYLPRGEKIKKGWGEYVKDGEMRVFPGHGTKDMLVPVSFF